MFGTLRQRHNKITLEDFLQETSLRRELRKLNLEYQLHDVRKPRYFRRNVFKTSGGSFRYVAGLLADVRDLAASISNAMQNTK